MDTPPQAATPLRRLLLAILALGLVAVYAGTGSLAAFTSQSSNPNQIQAGIVRLSRDAAGTTVFDVPALVPGETVNRPITIQNNGTLPFNYSLLVSAPTAGPLDQDPVNGLQLRVDRCATGPWATPTPDATTTYGEVCTNPTPGATAATVAVYSGPVINRIGGTPLTVPMGTALPAGGNHRLNLAVTLPESALQVTPGILGQRSALELVWRAEEQAATATPGLTGTAILSTVTATATPLPGTISSVTGFTVAPATVLADAPNVVHLLAFTTGRSLASGDSITITYPAGTSVSGLATSQVSLQVRAGAQFIAPGSVSVSGQVVTITLPGGQTAAAGSVVTLHLAGRTNPPNGTYTFSLHTSQQTVDASSTVVIGAGTALQFDGATRYVSVADADALDLTGNLTLEAWVYLESYGSIQTIITKPSANGNLGYGLRVNVNAQLNLTVSDGSNLCSYDATTSIPRIEWTHVAGVYDADEGIIKLYVNGVRMALNGDGSGTCSPGVALTNSTGALNIGRESASSGRYWNGILDEVRVWNYARPAAQLAQGVKTRLAGTESGLAGYWRFDEGTGTTTASAATASLTGTLVNGPT